MVFYRGGSLLSKLRSRSVHQPGLGLEITVRCLQVQTSSELDLYSELKELIPQQQVQSEFQKAYEKGIHKSKYWEPTYEDSLSLIAQVPTVVAHEYCRPNIYERKMNFQPCNSRGFTTAAALRLCTTKSPPYLRHCLLHNGPDTIDELLDRHLVKTDRKDHLDDDDDEIELLNQQRLTSTRREALSLYRDIIRATRFFVWPDSRGVLWRDVLRENARKEFEAARFEKDPEVVTRLLIGGRDAVQAAIDKLVEKQRQEIEKGRNASDRR